MIRILNIPHGCCPVVYKAFDTPYMWRVKNRMIKIQMEDEDELAFVLKYGYAIEYKEWVCQ